MDERADERQIVNYLLGELSEDGQKGVEERLLTDNEYYDLLLATEDDLIDAYLSGALDGRERERFEAHFLRPPERGEKLRFAMALRDYVSTRTAESRHEAAAIRPRAARRKWPPSPALWLAAAAVIIIAVALASWRIFFHEPGPSKGVTALNNAYREQRPVESRISRLDYAPFSVTRGAQDGKFDYVARDRAQALIHEEVAEYPGARSYHDLGRLYLAGHEFDKAIEQFDKALQLDDKNAPLHSDLGAAYLERAVADGSKPNLGDLAKSLEYLYRAIGLDDSLLAAYFNRALCLQRMNALTLARQAWEDYLKKDPDSEWSKEAERNLRLLRDRGTNNKTPGEVYENFLAAYRQGNEAQAWRIQSQTKEMITGTMIPFQLARRFLDASLSDRPASGKEILNAFRFAGELEKKQSGDPFFLELAGFYAASGVKNAPALKKAHEALGRGYQLCLHGNYSEAAAPLEYAQKHFLKAGDVWEARVVDYWLAYCLSQQGKLKKSSDLLAALVKNCRGRGYHWLESQSYCWLANNSALLGEYSRGVEEDKKALDIALAIGDLYNTQKTSSQLAEDYKFLGRLEEALEYNRLSLPAADAYFVSDRQLWRSLNSLTDTLFAIRLYIAAEAYEREALDLAANHFNDPVLIHNTYLRLGEIYSGQRNYAVAEQSLLMSLGAIKTIDDDLAIQKLFGQSVFQMGSVKRQAGDCTTALDYYHQAVEKFGPTEFGLYNYITRKGMLLCHLVNKDDAAIEAELPSVLSLFEQNRRRIKEEQNRNHFFDAEQDVYDLAVDYEYGRGNKEKSFNYAEYSRARTLLDLISARESGGGTSTESAAVTAASQPLSLSHLQESMQSDLQLVEYAVLQDRLLIWVVTKGSFKAFERPVSLAALEAATDEYFHVLPRGDAYSIRRESQLAAQLYDWLFAPLEDHLSKEEEVALVPDKFLFKVPFAALLSRHNGRRLVDDYTLLYAPSATVLVLCSDLAQKKSPTKEGERLLSVGDPKFNPRRHPDLPELPMAAAEAKNIATFYAGNAVFVGSEAVKKAIKPELASADVIHLATHYLADDFSPANSRLVLADGPDVSADDTADLSLEEIGTGRLPKARLVILAACQSGIERYYAGEGPVGLSRAFMMAGAPLVIASQWAVESGSTSDLMVEFHRLRKTENLSTTQALRQAQHNMMSHEDGRYRRPYYWAGFFPIGGHARF